MDDGVTVKEYTTPFTVTDIGSKTIRAKTTDNAGNISEEATVTVTIMPEIKLTEIIINNNDEFTNDKKIKVSLNYPENTTEIRIFNLLFRKESLIPRWQKPSHELDWNLNGFLGENTVYVQFKYSDGSISEIFSDTIIYDQTRPWGMVTVNNWASSANTAKVKVKVKITALEFESTVDQMQISNSPGFSGANWQPYQEEFDWELEPLEGDRPQIRRVYVKLKDKAGNVSSFLQGFILLKPS